MAAALRGVVHRYPATCRPAQRHYEGQLRARALVHLCVDYRNPTGPATVADNAVDSGRWSAVQVEPDASQSVVCGSLIVTAPAEAGSTVMFHS